MDSYKLPPDASLFGAGTSRSAEEMHAGDLFVFRGTLYLALSCFTDRRHAQTVITAAEAVGEDDPAALRRVAVLRLYRTFRMPVLGQVPIGLSVTSNSHREAAGCPDPVLEG